MTGHQADRHRLKVDRRYWADLFWSSVRDHRHWLITPSDEMFAFRKEMVSIAHDSAESMWSIYQRHYDGLCTFKEIFIDLDWDHHRTTHWGGRRKRQWMINIAMSLATVPVPFREYESYNLDPEIGYVDSFSPATHLIAAIAHELAHVAQRQLDMKFNRRSSPHGEEFRSLLRILRTEFVNPKPMGDQKNSVEIPQNL